MQLKILFVFLFSLLSISMAIRDYKYIRDRFESSRTGSNTTTITKPVLINVNSNNLTDYVPTSPHGILETTTIKLTSNDTETSMELEIYDVFVEATKVSFKSWEVQVGWGLPRLLPDSYTVDLFTNSKSLSHRYFLPGNVSGVMIDYVTGEGTYDVFIQARLGTTTATSNITAEFPEERDMAQNIFVEAIKDSVDTWAVHVAWEIMIFRFDSYTVTLLTEKYGNHTIKIQWVTDSLKVVFKNVKGEGTYYVLIQTRHMKTIARKKIKAQFPEEGMMPQNITVEAIKDSVDTWEVHVGWGLPHLLPDSYTVTVVTKKYGNHTIEIPGNPSEVVFKNVKGEGTYYVSIQPKFPETSVKRKTRARFPDERHVPQNVTVEAIKDSVDTWEVHVGWGLPRLLPDSYTVTLVTKKYVNHTIEIPGHRFEPFYPNMLFRRECDREIEEIEQHVYEEVGPPIYDVIAPSICSYEEVDPIYEEINPSADVEGG